MKTIMTFNTISLALLLALGVTACDKKPGPAETAGKNIDQATQAAGQKMDEAGQKIGKAGDKVGETLSEQSSKAGTAIDDTAITTKVKAAIFAEPGLKSLQISVDTIHGVVTLTGSADTQSSSDRIEALAAAVSGVKSVENKLVVKPIN